MICAIASMLFPQLFAGKRPILILWYGEFFGCRQETDFDSLVCRVLWIIHVMLAVICAMASMLFPQLFAGKRPILILWYGEFFGCRQETDYDSGMESSLDHPCCACPQLLFCGIVLSVRWRVLWIIHVVLAPQLLFWGIVLSVR